VSEISAHSDDLEVRRLSAENVSLTVEAHGVLIELRNSQISLRQLIAALQKLDEADD
jgi:hypothetical protein